MTPWSEMSLYLYQRSPTRPGTAAGAEARAHTTGWGCVGGETWPPAPAASPGAPPDRAVPQAGHLCAAGGRHYWAHLPPPGWAARPACARAALSTRTAAGGEEEGGGGGGRKGEGSGAESGGGSPSPGHWGTRCEGVRFPPTPFLRAAPSPATQPPFAARQPGSLLLLVPEP